MAKVGKPYFNIPDEWFRQQKQAHRAQLEKAGEAVAASLRSTASGRDGAPEVIVSSGNDRNGAPKVLVLLAEPDGVAQQVKSGVVTRAAAANGLDVHRYQPR